MAVIAVLSKRIFQISKSSLLAVRPLRRFWGTGELWAGGPLIVVEQGLIPLMLQCQSQAFKKKCVEPHEIVQELLKQKRWRQYDWPALSGQRSI